MPHGMEEETQYNELNTAEIVDIYCVTAVVEMLLWGPKEVAAPLHETCLKLEAASNCGRV